METKLSKLKSAWKSGDKFGALRIASTFGRLGDHEKAIMTGWNAANNPGFYKQIGKNPDELLQKAYDALIEKYKLD